MMDHFRFEVSTGRLQDAQPDGNPLPLLQRAGRRLSEALLGPTDTTNTGPVDRSQFYHTDESIEQAVHATEVVFADSVRTADEVAKISRRDQRWLGRQGIQAFSAAALQKLDDTHLRGRQVGAAIRDARLQRIEMAQNAAWWTVFADHEQYEHDLFAADPLEQFVITQGDQYPVQVYNYHHPLSRRNVRDIASTVHTMSEITQGYSRVIVPSIVIHDSFRPTCFPRSGHTKKPDGQAWNGEPFIEVGAGAFRNSDGSVGQSWLAQVIAHEETHQIDAEHHPDIAEFSRYFKAVDVDGDGLINHTEPRREFLKFYRGQHIEPSKPHRDYGLTNFYEDFATVAEEVPFGGSVDLLRRDAFNGIMQEFIRDQDQKRGPEVAATLRRSLGASALSVVRRTGSEIQLPRLAMLDNPIRIAFLGR